ncbi:MAG: BlaI/MecI/CopY family transcriptional regulator [Cyanobacteria bacterium P01_F01_bin.42]
MSALPIRKPNTLTLGPLESEILEILWVMTRATVREIHEQILSDPDRELAYSSVTTVLNRLAKKGWVKCDRQEQAFVWRPTLTKLEAQALIAHDQLQDFLALGHPDVIAAFADSLDETTVEQLDAIAQQIRAARNRGLEES